MTKRKQVQFVRALTRAVADGVVNMIRDGHTPETWDGHELRELLARRFDRERGDFLRDRRSRRYKDYMFVVSTVPR